MMGGKSGCVRDIAWVLKGFLDIKACSQSPVGYMDDLGAITSNINTRGVTKYGDDISHTGSRTQRQLYRALKKLSIR